MTGRRPAVRCLCFSSKITAFHSKPTSNAARLFLVGILILVLAGWLQAQSSPSMTGHWTLTAAMSQARTGAAAAAMSNGRVLVTGGVDGSGAASASAEI